MLQPFLDDGDGSICSRHSTRSETSGQAFHDLLKAATVTYNGQRLLSQAGVQVTTGSNAHSMERIGGVDALDALLQEAGFSPDRL